MGDNIRQLLEITEHYETSKKAGLIFIADFDKAFDEVRLDFIYKCL
uniref:Reverse transcriptase domain-containing protein n=1 Tax=Anguilla anguilla TaxID=7936 RepID=A0A0E9TR80_ANGAN